ncbi:alpha/beta fold hydrolase [candidate division KSB1 bacterium]
MLGEKQFNRRRFLQYSLAAAAGYPAITKLNSKLNHINYGGKMKHVYFDYLNHKIYYETRGDSQNTLVFIHGWTSSIESWKFQLDSFPAYKVIAVDLPGNGKSSKNEDAEYTMEMFADSVAAILKNERVGKAFFIGHSMGFTVSEVLAVKYPELCAGICSVDGVHFELPEDEKGKTEWKEYNRSFAESLKTEKGRDAFINALFLPDTPDILKNEVFKTSRKVPLSIGRSMVEGVEKDIKYWTKRVMNIPCIAIHSPVFQLSEDYKKDFMKMYPKAEYHEIQNVSHFLMLEIPYRINQLINNYLDKILYE